MNGLWIHTESFPEVIEEVLEQELRNISSSVRSANSEYAPLEKYTADNIRNTQNRITRSR